MNKVIGPNHELETIPAQYRAQARSALRQQGVKQPSVAQITARSRELYDADGGAPDPFAGLTGEELEDAKFEAGMYDACPDGLPNGFRRW
jgi:hypothetical protein